MLTLTFVYEILYCQMYASFFPRTPIDHWEVSWGMKVVRDVMFCVLVI
jgi:hypothetical protein